MAFDRRGPKLPQSDGCLRESDGQREYRACRAIERSGHLTQRHERGFVLQHEGRSTAPSARSGSLDDVDGGPDGRVYIQMRGIEQVRIRRLS